MSYLAVATVRRFDPDTGTTVEVAPLPAPRTGAVAVRIADGRVLVAGGSEQARLESGVEAPPTATAFIYDPGRDSWATTAPMPFASRPGQAVLLADGSVLVTGGSIPYPEAVVDVCEDNAVGWTARFLLGPGQAAEAPRRRSRFRRAASCRQPHRRAAGQGMASGRRMSTDSAPPARARARDRTARQHVTFGPQRGADGR